MHLITASSLGTTQQIYIRSAHVRRSRTLKMASLMILFVTLLGFMPGAYGSCIDSTSYCDGWRTMGFCDRSSPWFSYMQKNCAKSCGLCVVAPPPVPTTQDPYPDCMDASSYCSSYKDYCRDPNYVSYLQQHCKRTCNFCHITTLPPPTTKPVTTKFWTLPSKSGTLQPGCGKKGPGHTRIVGGTASKPGDWPWIVTFDYKYNNGNPGHQCGGTLLTEEWILSAAHCFYDDQNKDNYWLTLGEHDLKTDSGHEQKIPIADLVFHPDYNPTTYDNDLALVKLSKKATINDRVKTACLPDQNTTFPVGTNCTVAGWGLLQQYGRGPQILQQAKVPLVDRAVCKAAYPHHVFSNNMICAGYAAGGIDACQGDSGGPLVCKRKDDTWFLWGVVSWGVGCGRSNKYGVYARTQVLRRWVDQVVFAAN